MEAIAGLIEFVGNLVIDVCRWAFARETKRKADQRGFEVKRTTGETPVPREEHKAD